MRRKKIHERFLLNVKFGLRVLRKRPGFTAAAIITLALSIGAATAIFSIIDNTLLRPLPFPNSERLAWITSLLPELDMQLVTGDSYLQWRNHATAFDEIAAFRPDESYNLTWPGEVSRVRVALVSANFLETLEVSLMQGRNFTEKEDSPGQDSVAIVSSRFFEQRFGGNSILSGQSVVLDDKAYTLVGVLPPGFHLFDHPDVDILVPLALDPAQEISGERSTIVQTIGRLKRGATFSQGRLNLETIEESAETDQKASSKPEVTPLKQHFVRGYQRTLLLLQCAVALVLLIGCVNLANLFLSGLSARQREFAIRNALGASAGRLAEQILTESLILSFLGGMLGLFVSIMSVKAFGRLAPHSMVAFLPSGPDTGLNLRLFAITCVLTLMTGFLVGIVPAFSARRSDWLEALRETSQGGGRGWRQTKTRRFLIACQMALALILATETGLLLKSLYRLVEVDPGFRPQNVLTFYFQLSPDKYGSYGERASLCAGLIERMTAIPGVEAVGLSDSLPLSGNATELYALSAENSPQLTSRVQQPIDMVYVSPGYFQAMGIRLIRGRTFSDADSTKMPVVVVSTGVARHFWGSEYAIEKRIKKGPMAPWSRVIGVVEDIHRNGLDKNTTLTVYEPWFKSDLEGIISVSVRSRMTPSVVLRESRQVVQSLDKDVPIYNVATMEQRLSDSMSSQRFDAFSLGSFAGLAIVLVAVGIYGLISFFVSQRMHEIGVRMALGATTSDILRLIFTEGLSLLPLAIGLGTPSAFLLATWSRKLLFEVQPIDWGIYLLSIFVLSVTTLVACLVPALRGVAVDPIAILRYE